MNLYSYAKKIVHIIYAKFLTKKNFIYPNLYLFNLKRDELCDVKRVLFALNSREYMHLGDHLFFIPLIKTFIDSGYHVEVTATKPMLETFKMLNLNVATNQVKFEDYDLIISRFELIRRLKYHKALLVHVSKNLTKPICEQMLVEFSKYFKLKDFTAPNYGVFHNEKIAEKFKLPQNKKLLMFNLYCDASSYLITQAKKDILLNFVKEYATNPHYAILMVGSKHDKLFDKNVYDFDFIDLRGITSVRDIFELVSLANVEYYIGFDAFVMHVFSLLKKRSFIVFRGRVTKKQDTMLRKYHVHLFENDNFVTLLK